MRQRFNLSPELFYDKAKEYQNKAIKIIENSANIISKEKDKEIFISKEYFNKIIQEEIKEASSENKKPKVESKPAVFAFCPSCGFKNENNFAFCPSCGNDLKQ